jgi:dTDP-4-dehydrorhamnose 3,5-epimerase
MSNAPARPQAANPAVGAAPKAAGQTALDRGLAAAASGIRFEVTAFAIRGPLLLRTRKFADERGFVSETFSARELAQLVGPVHFVQENHALSRAAGTVRGLHFQAAPAAQGKLLRVVHGAVFDVAVDIRPGSPTWGAHVAITLRAGTLEQFWIPAGFAHGFCTLEPDTEVIYKLTSYYSPEHERGIAWDDPGLAIDWPVSGAAAVLSPRDRSLPRLASLHRQGLAEPAAN